MHNAAVRQLVPEQQLLIFKTGEGWQRLCQFLDKPVPDAPFPRENVAGQTGNVMDQLQEFKTQTKINEEVRRSVFIGGASIVAAIAVSAVILLRNKTGRFEIFKRILHKKVFKIIKTVLFVQE